MQHRPIGYRIGLITSRICMYLQLRFRSDPSAFWQFVKSRRKCNTLPNEVYLDSQTTNNNADICELFDTHFSKKVLRAY